MYLLVIILLCILSGCDRPDDGTRNTFNKLFSATSAKQNFQLNSECGKLGKEFFKEQVGEIFQRSDSYQRNKSSYLPTSGGGSGSFTSLDGKFSVYEVTSYYNPETNHCYSILKTWSSQSSSDPTKPETSIFLHDNQTGEDLANTSEVGFAGNEKRQGKITTYHKVTVLDDGWTDANEYIDHMMDRKR